MVAPLVPPQTEQGEFLTKTIPPTPASPTLAPPVPMPEATSTTLHVTPIVPPVGPTTSAPSITISASEFHALVHTFQTLTTTHATLFQHMAEMHPHQDQQTAILRQIQQHLGLLPPPQPDLPTSSEPLAPAKDTILVEDTTTVEVQIPPPQEATTDAIASVDPQDEPQIVDIVTPTPDDASSPHETGTT